MQRQKNIPNWNSNISTHKATHHTRAPSRTGDTAAPPTQTPANHSAHLSHHARPRFTGRTKRSLYRRARVFGSRPTLSRANEARREEVTLVTRTCSAQLPLTLWERRRVVWRGGQGGRPGWELLCGRLARVWPGGVGGEFSFCFLPVFLVSGRRGGGGVCRWV